MLPGKLLKWINLEPEVKTKFGFEELKLHRIEAWVANENSRSVRILKKVGMKKLGVRRKILPVPVSKITCWYAIDRFYICYGPKSWKDIRYKHRVKSSETLCNETSYVDKGWKPDI